MSSMETPPAGHLWQLHGRHTQLPYHMPIAESLSTNPIWSIISLVTLVWITTQQAQRAVVDWLWLSLLLMVQLCFEFPVHAVLIVQRLTTLRVCCLCMIGGKQTLGADGEVGTIRRYTERLSAMDSDSTSCGLQLGLCSFCQGASRLPLCFLEI